MTHSDQDHFFSKINFYELFFQIFEADAESYFFIKDANGHFIWMNEALRKHLGIMDSNYIGTSDADYFPADLTQRYQKEDLSVMRSGKPIRNQPWIVPDRKGNIFWYISSKIPLYAPSTSFCVKHRLHPKGGVHFEDELQSQSHVGLVYHCNEQTNTQQEIIGIAGLMRNYTHLAETIQPHRDLQNVIAYILKHYPQKIFMEELASQVLLSVSQFERQFKRIFHMSPTSFIMKVRLDAAMRLLSEGDLAVTQIAHKVGFYDSSSFNRQFRRVCGMTPLEFRRKYSHMLRTDPREPPT